MAPAATRTTRARAATRRAGEAVTRKTAGPESIRGSESENEDGNGGEPSKKKRKTVAARTSRAAQGRGASKNVTPGRHKGAASTPASTSSGSGDYAPSDTSSSVTESDETGSDYESTHADKASPPSQLASSTSVSKPSDKPAHTALASQSHSYLETPHPFLSTYPVTHNEVGVLTVQPYKDALLPLWRFKTPDIAQTSAEALWDRFQSYGGDRDFVGMDMARKFIQMGMTRAKRYANYKGGRKYLAADGSEAEKKSADGKVLKGRDGKPRGGLLDKSEGHAGQQEKEEASRIFRAYWEQCKEDETYAELKKEFLNERQKLEKGG